jgi:hypothetical protein
MTFQNSGICIVHHMKFVFKIFLQNSDMMIQLEVSTIKYVCFLNTYLSRVKFYSIEEISK